jgi:hypothetical protein
MIVIGSLVSDSIEGDISVSLILSNAYVKSMERTKVALLNSMTFSVIWRINVKSVVDLF